MTEGLFDKWSRRGVPHDVLARVAEAIDISPPGPAVPFVSAGPDLGQVEALKCAGLASAAGVDRADTYDFYRDIRRWQAKYLLLVEVPLGSLTSDRFVLALSYAESIPALTLFGDGWPSARRLFAVTRKVVAGSMSWGMRIPAPSVVDADTSHISIEAPSGFRAIDCALRVESVGPDGRKLATWHRDDDWLRSAAHSIVRTEERRVTSADFMVNFYAYRTGFFLESLVSSLVLFGVLEVFYLRLAKVHFVVQSAGLDSNLAAAVVLLVPAAVVALVSQRDAHRVASRAFALGRFLLALAAAANLAAATVLAMAPSREIADATFMVAAWTAGVAAGRLILGSVVHVWRLSGARDSYVRLKRRFEQDVN